MFLKGLDFEICNCNRVSVAGQLAASQCETNRFHILVWWVTLVSICATTCCSSNVIQGCEQPDLATECVMMCVRARVCVAAGGVFNHVNTIVKMRKTKSSFCLRAFNGANRSECEAWMQVVSFLSAQTSFNLCVWACHSVWVWFPPTMHSSELADWNGKQTEPKRGKERVNDCRCVRARECVVLTVAEKKNSSGKLFLLWIY